MTGRVPPLKSILETVGSAIPARHLFGSSTPTGATPSTGNVGIDPTAVIAFASDEDVAIRAGADYASLCGDSQTIARGQDGTFAGAPSDPWTLTSATVNFANQGVQSYDVVKLEFPNPTSSGVSYNGKPQILAIDTVSGTSITLRRLGLASGMGDPPCPPGGFNSPIKFIVPTLYPQIIAASLFMRQQYGLNEWVYGRLTSQLWDLIEFVEPCVFKVLSLRYLDASRSASKETGDDYRAKAGFYQDQMTSILDRLVVHFQPTFGRPSPDLSRFGTRIVR